MTDEPCLAALAEAINELHVPVDRGVLAGLLDLRSALEARLVAAVLDWDRSGLWLDPDGAASVTAWLKAHGQLTSGDATRLAGLARLVGHAPEVGTAWVAGDLGGGQVAVIRANVARDLEELFAEHAPDLVPHLVGLTVEETTVAMRAWALRAEAARDTSGTDPEDRRDQTRTLHLSPTLDGMGRLDGNLTPDAHALLDAALRIATDPYRAADGRSAAQRRHDGLAAIALHFLDHQQASTGGRDRGHINIVIDIDNLTSDDPAASGVVIPSGIRLSARNVKVHACDPILHRVMRSGTSTLDYGRSTREFSEPLFTTLAIRDGGCRFPHCDRPVSWTHAHHIHEWEDGGETNQHNAVLLCHFHHGLIHKKGWTLHMDQHAVVTVTHPDGHTSVSHPRHLTPAAPPRDTTRPAAPAA